MFLECSKEKFSAGNGVNALFLVFGWASGGCASEGENNVLFF